MVVKLFIKKRAKTRKIKRRFSAGSKYKKSHNKKSYNKKRNTRRSNRNNTKKNATRRRSFYGGNYTTDATKEQFQGFDVVNESKAVVAFPGGVMSLKDYKKKLDDDDVDGFNPLD